MCSELVCVAVLWMCGASPADDPRLFTRVRSTERYTIALIREGYDRSGTFRHLVDTLQRSDVIVVIQRLPCAGGRIRSCLVSVSGSPGARQIGIKIDPQHTIGDWLIATIAHELQHAVEIADHPEVIDARSAIALYRKIGIGRCREGLSEECETERALDTEKTVRDELGKVRGRRSQGDDSSRLGYGPSSDSEQRVAKVVQDGRAIR